MLSVEDAFKHLVLGQSPLTTERRGLIDAVGYVLAAPVRARRSQPAADLSAMDGYAVASIDMTSEALTLPVMRQEARAGTPGFTLTPGYAARIFTGAVVPTGADQIIIQEDATQAGDSVSLPGRAQSGQHIRTAGADFQDGDIVIDAGTYISPKMVALMAAAGAAHTMVYRAPRVDILAVGDELVDAASNSFDAYQTVDSARPMITGLLAEAGADVHIHDILPDQLATITETLGKASGDIVLTVGGASVGDHDYIGRAFDAIGVQRDFWKVAMRPGKPLFVGQKAGQRYIGLPGNAVSAFVTAFLFVRPLVDQMMGRPVPPIAGIPLPCATDLPANGTRTHFMRARLIGDIGSRHVDPAHDQDSSMVSVLAASDGLLIRPGGADAVKAGENVPYIPF